jgi:2-polyprenyl-3-methyl-5-hydroxy-6-metoxy-1,4-benzoquinol methylase
VTDYGYFSGASASGDTGIALSRRILATLVARGAGERVCELGCGNGYLASLLTSAGFRVIGVDSSESGVAIARKFYGHCEGFLCRPIEPGLAAVLGRGQFDAVVSSEVIEHLYRPRDLLEVAFSILRPGGLLLLTTPYHGYMKNLAIVISGKFDAHFNPLWDGGHIKFFSRATLRELVSGTGFIDVSFSYFARSPLLWKSMVCTARKDADELLARSAESR